MRSSADVLKFLFSTHFVVNNVDFVEILHSLEEDLNFKDVLPVGT